MISRFDVQQERSVQSNGLQLQDLTQKLLLSMVEAARPCLMDLLVSRASRLFIPALQQKRLGYPGVV